MKSVKGKVTCMWMCCQTLYTLKILSPLKGNFLQERFSQLGPFCSFKPWTGKSVLEVVITGNRNQTTRAWIEISLVSTQKNLLTFSTRNNGLSFLKCCQCWKFCYLVCFPRGQHKANRKRNDWKEQSKWGYAWMWKASMRKERGVIFSHLILPFQSVAISRYPPFFGLFISFLLWLTRCSI